jgi:hypothetical protein
MSFTDKISDNSIKTEVEKTIQVYTLCENCNQEFELKSDDYNNCGVFFVFGTCPKCQTKNNRWLRIKVKGL